MYDIEMVTGMLRSFGIKSKKINKFKFFKNKLSIYNSTKYFESSGQKSYKDTMLTGL